MKRAFLDANIFLYALGREHPYRGPCRRVLRALRERTLAGETSVEVVQEVIHVVRRRGTSGATVAQIGRDVMRACDKLHAFERRDLDVALELIGEGGDLTVRDAVHAAVCLNRDLDVIVSADPHFDAVPRLQRIDPLDDAALQRLIGP